MFDFYLNFIGVKGRKDRNELSKIATSSWMFHKVITQ